MDNNLHFLDAIQLCPGGVFRGRVLCGLPAPSTVTTVLSTVTKNRNNSCYDFSNEHLFLPSPALSSCPASSGDKRALDCRHVYIESAHGNVTRNLDIFAGKLTVIRCIAHCGCLSKTYAGIDNVGYCFCGNNKGSNSLCSSTECLRKIVSRGYSWPRPPKWRWGKLLSDPKTQLYSATGVPASPSATFVAKAELYTSTSVTISGALTNVTQFAVVEDYKLSYFVPTSGSIAFAQTGSRKAHAEIEAYWGCRTPESEVSVYSKLKIKLHAPAAALPGVTFDAYVDIFEGSGIQSVTFTLDGSTYGSTITNIGEPLITATGPEMSVDRYYNYTASFTRPAIPEGKTYINPNFEFYEVCRVKAFEAYATKKGPIRFQVFKPMCDQTQTEKTYCHALKTCVSSGCGTPVANKPSFYPPSSKPVFCPDVERFKSNDGQVCPGVPTISVQGADYQLVGEFEANMTTIGNNIVKIPDSKNITVQPGYVTGFTIGSGNDTGDIGYHVIKAEDMYYPEFEHSEVFDTHTGSVFHRHSPSVKLFSNYHLFTAHSSCATRYLKKVTLSNLGQPYTLGVTVTAAESTASGSMVIAVEQILTAFTLTAPVKNSFINTDVLFEISAVNSEVGVFYACHFGVTSFNGTFDVPKSSEKKFTTQYKKPGIYNVLCQAYNMHNYVERNVTVHIFTRVSTIEFLKPVDPEPTGNVSTSISYIRNGWQGLLSYEFGDATAEKIWNVTFCDHFLLELQYTYASEGDYLIKVNAKTPLETKQISQYASVEDTIVTVAILPPGVAATNRSHRFDIGTHVGTNVTYIWYWMDGTNNSISAVNQRHMYHTYTTYNNRTVSAYAYNKISSMNVSMFIEVQDVILGLEIIQPETSKYPITPVATNTKTNVFFRLTQGTGMDLHVDWHTKSPGTRVSKTAYDLDFLGKQFRGVGTHQYTANGYYNVTVYVTNAVSNMSVSALAVYEVPITDFPAAMRQKDDPASYIEVNETVCFDMIYTQGQSVLIRYEFGDNTTIITPNKTVCHSYSYWKLPFKSKFEIYNNVSSISKALDVFVQWPVHRFRNLSISGGPDNTTEEMDLYLNMLQGDYFNCTWTINDTAQAVKYSTYDVDVFKKRNIKHRFATPGVYGIGVFCKNRLYNASATHTVISYIPASNFKVRVTYAAQCGAKKSAGSLGDGADNDMFGFGCLLKFEMLEQMGSNITFTAKFGTTIAKTTGNYLTNTFPHSAEKSVEFQAFNPVSRVVKTVELQLFSRISGIKVGNNGPIKAGVAITLNLTVSNIGEQSCFVVTTEIEKLDNSMLYEQFWLGDSSCKYKTKYKAIDARPDLNPKSAKWTKVFSQVGKFRVMVVGENVVSTETASTTVTILDKPCYKPVVAWNNINDNIFNANNITKSKRYICQIKVQKNCEKTDALHYNWTLTHCASNSKIETINTTKTDTAFTIPKRTLDYGCYKLISTVCMADVVPSVCTSIVGYFKIVPTDLVASFVGGTGRAVGRKNLVTIAATDSHDPDIGPTTDGLKFNWYCKLQMEKFPSNLPNLTSKIMPLTPHRMALNDSLNFTTSGFKGCFGLGMGQLGTCKNKPNCIFNTTFMPLYKYYSVKLVVCKPTPGMDRKCVDKVFTLYVVDGDPPTINISPLDKAAKIDSFKEFKSLAKCTSSCKDIVYLWSMDKKLVGAPDETLKPVTDFEQNWLLTDINKKNLVVKANKFSTKYTYVLRLSGWPRRTPEIKGFSMYTVNVNEAPKSRGDTGVRVLPAEGEPLQKIFYAVFASCEDEDGPLTYVAEYRKTPNSKWTQFHNSINTKSDNGMFPEGVEAYDYKLKIRTYCQDAFGSKSQYVFKEIRVKKAKAETVDLSAILAASAGSTDPAAAGMVVSAVISTMTGPPDPKVVSEALNLLANAEVNSPEGAIALSDSCNAAANTGAMTEDSKAQVVSTMSKVADFVNEDTPSDVVASLTSNVFSVSLSATGSLSGSGAAATLEKSEKMQLTIGLKLGQTKVPGESAFEVKTGDSLLAVQSMESSGDGGVNLGSGSFSMDGALSGEEPFQALGGSGPNKYDAASGQASDVTSSVLSLSMAVGGKSVAVKNASKPIKISLPAPTNPYTPKMHQSYLDRLKLVHKVAVTSNSSSLFIELKNHTEIDPSVKIFVMIRKFKSPTLSDHHWNITLPKEVHHFTANGTNKTQEQIALEEKHRMRIYLNSKKDLNHTAKGDFYVAILNTCNFTSNGTAVNSTVPPVNYTMTSYSRSCQYRDKKTNKWSEEGLTISEETDENATICYTTHLSSFAGGGVFAQPNAIDFDKAFAGFSNIGENPAVFATVLSMIGVYFILLAYCRYKDKLDIEKIGVFPLEDNHPGDNYLYEVAVQTGFAKGSGTTSDVFIILSGSLGETAPRKLKNPNRKCYNKGETDAFLLTTPFSLGIIKEIEIWHNNTGHSPGWYCMQVQIRDTQSDKRWSFVCNSWLAVEEGDGLIKRTIEVAGKDDLTQFDFLFAQTARKNLYDGHIWFSVFTRPPRSTFTRCQRLGCCLTLLMTSMLANAMFYKDPAGGADAKKTAAADSIHLGPITISVDQIRIGFTSSLVVMPVNIIIATLFQKAKPREEKPKKKKNKYEVDGDEDDDTDDDEAVLNARSQPEISASKISIVEKGEFNYDEENNQTAEALKAEKSQKRANFLKMICMPGNEDDDDAGDTNAKGSKKKKPKKKATLPHWVIYIAYALIFIGSGTSAFFVILYGFSFGKEKSEGWLVSMMVVALSVLIAMIIKDPKAASGDEESAPRALGKDEVAQDGKKKRKKKKKIGENGEELSEFESEEEEEVEETKNRAEIDFKLPDPKSLEESRQMRLKEKRMKSIIREIVIHLLFVMLCLFIGYSNMDPFAYTFGSGVKSFTSSELQSVSKVEDYWSWLDNTFIPYLYPGKWYNGNPNWTHGFVADTEPSKIISMARMRQLRVKKNKCTIHPMFKDLVAECNAEYSWGNEQQGQYSAGWKPPLNKTETRKLRVRKRKAYWLGLEDPWKYQSVLKLKNFPFMGKFATYSGSSFSVSIGPDQRIAKLIIKGMKDNFWIDQYTRAVFVELNLYNANTNLMMIVTYLSEILPTGGWNYFDNVQAIRLYRWQGGLGAIIMVADLILLVVTLVGIYKLVKTCKKEGFKSYFKNPWHLLHMFVTIFSIATFACVAARLGAVMWAMSQYKKNPEQFVSFAYVGQLDYFVSAFVGFVVFFTNLEFLKLLRFNRRIGLLTTTMKQSAKPLMSFGLIFFLLFLSYVSLAHFIFVDQLEEYRKLSTSIVALVKMFLGKFDVGAYLKVAPILGPFLFFTYMLVVQMVLINMFIGIICETFEEVRTDLDQQSNEHEIVSFMTTRFKKMAGATVGSGFDPIYREWKSDWEVTLDSIEEKTESIVYFMRNIEAEEVRQTNWMEPTKANEKKRNMLKMLVGSDEFVYENEILDSLQVIDKRLKKVNAEKSRSMVYKMAKKKKKEKEEEMQFREEETPNLSEEDDTENDENDNDASGDE
eukprot:gene8930-9882_t